MPTKSGTSSPRLLWTVVLLMAGAAAMLWGASALTWMSQRFRTPLSGERSFTLAGSMLRPELGPVALAGLAAVAAVLATGGLLRRVVGFLVLSSGGLLIWRSVSQDFAWFTYTAGIPPGSTPIGQLSLNPAGPLLMSAGGLALAFAGALVVLRARRMPSMGAKYSAPGEAKKRVKDPDRQLWDALDADQDPTDDDRRW